MSRAPRSFGLRQAGSVLFQHAIIADDGSTLRQRWFDATLPNAVLEGGERRQLRQRARAVIDRGFDEMDEGVVLQPQRHITETFRLRRLQFRKHRGDQFGILFGHIRLSPVPYHGPSHGVLLVAAAKAARFDPKDAWNPPKDAVSGKIFSGLPRY